MTLQKRHDEVAKKAERASKKMSLLANLIEGNCPDPTGVFAHRLVWEGIHRCPNTHVSIGDELGFEITWKGEKPKDHVHSVGGYEIVPWHKYRVLRSSGGLRQAARDHAGRGRLHLV